MLHILTPFSRNENLNFYLKNLEDKKIIWHPIVHEKLLFASPWIQPFYVFSTLPKEDPNYHKLNLFIDNFYIIDTDLYLFMNDDDWVEEDTLDRLKGFDDNLGEVFFCSMKRGHQVPNNEGIQQHGIETLIPYKGVGCGSIGLEQIILKGDVLKQVKFNTSPEVQHMSDGVLAEELQKKYDVKYLEDVFMLFNYLEPGRWNKEKQLSNIKERFEQSKKESRDISEHLDTLKKYADECKVIVELGVNEGISTTAWALSLEENNNDRFVYCYDYIGPQEYLKPLLQECENKKLNLTFALEDDLKIEIPECDLLFIDTLHTGEQLRQEFKLHAEKAKKYIILHDTEAFKLQGVIPNSEGLQLAINDFLKENHTWKLREHFSNCNGLTILEKI